MLNCCCSVLSTDPDALALGDILLRDGMQRVFGWSTDCLDSAGPYLARGFFGALQRGASYDEAYDCAKDEVSEAGEPARVELLTRTNQWHQYAIPRHRAMRSAPNWP